MSPAYIIETFSILFGFIDCFMIFLILNAFDWLFIWFWSKILTTRSWIYRLEK